MAVHPQGEGVALQDPAVLEVEDVETVRFRVGVALSDARYEGVRIGELVLDVRDEGRGIAGGDLLGGEPPHFLKAAIMRNDPAFVVDDQDPIRRRFERGLQHGHGEGVGHPTGFLRPRLRLGTACGHGPNLRVPAPVTRLTGVRANRT